MSVSSSPHGFPLRICSPPFPKAFQGRQHCLNMSLHFLFLHIKTAEEVGGGSLIPLCSLGLWWSPDEVSDFAASDRAAARVGELGEMALW